MQGRQNNRMNKVVGAVIESGLNVIETPNRFTHISETANFMDIHKGTVFYLENAKAIMNKQNLVTLAFNGGEE